MQNLHPMKTSVIAFSDGKNTLSNGLNSFAVTILIRQRHSSVQTFLKLVTFVFLSFQNMNTKLLLLCRLTPMFRIHV